MCVAKLYPNSPPLSFACPRPITSSFATPALCPNPLFAPQNVSVPSSDRGTLRVQYAKNPFGQRGITPALPHFLCSPPPQNVSVPSSDRGALRVQYAKNPFGKKRDISGQLIDTLPRDMQVCVYGGGREC